MPSSLRVLENLPLSIGSGGTYTATSGESFRIYVSSAYPPQTFDWFQGWANTVAGLPHGVELSKLTAYFAPLSEVQTICHSGDAAACYFPGDSTMILPLDGLPASQPLFYVLEHEYGHHVAANRDNTPWDASITGPKRWATYEHVCSRTELGTAFPGDEGAHYALNPGEAWAETYRFLQIQVGPGSPPPPAFAVDSSFSPLIPYSAALTAALQDVTSPWSGPTTTNFAVRLTRAHPKTTVTLPTPLDGSLTIRTRAPRNSAVVVTPAADDGSALKRQTTAPASYEVCGQRTVHLSVALRRGGGNFTLSVTHP
jgi:hypothetical protein